MYGEQLRAETVEISSIHLDPNNPRFWNEDEERTTAQMIPDPDVQQETLNRIKQYNIDPLYHSILRNGFLPIDKIVVRPIEHEDAEQQQYVVVEGNRRIAAVKLLRAKIDRGTLDEEEVDDEELQELFRSLEELSVLVYEGTDDNISWRLQGIRHISGIKDWPPAQKGRVVAERIEEDGMNFTAAGQSFGLSSHQVGRLYRGYKALQQFKEDEEFGDKATNRHFTILQEAWKNRGVRDWLECS